MAEHDDFRRLLERVRAGEAAAAAELVRRYEPEVRRAIHVRMTDPGLRRLLDSMDICQSVMANFFLHAALGQYQCARPEQLFKLLVAMARNKLRDHVRRQQAGRRDQRRRLGNEKALNALPSADLTPSWIVAGDELLREVRSRLSDEERYLAEQRALGRGWAELAAERQDSPEALRKRLVRGVDRVAQEMGLEDTFHA